MRRKRKSEREEKRMKDEDRFHLFVRFHAYSHTDTPLPAHRNTVRSLDVLVSWKRRAHTHARPFPKEKFRKLVQALQCCHSLGAMLREGYATCIVNCNLI